MFESDLRVVEEMCLSLRLKKNVMRVRNNYFFLSSEEEEDNEEDKEGAKNETMESQQRKILRKNSRLGFSTKKKGPHKTCLSSSQERKARARGCACVCVCVDLERRE